MPTYTLQDIVDQMRKKKLSKPDYGIYIEFHADPNKGQLMPKPEKVHACAVGEAVLQLAVLSEQCVSGLNLGYDQGLNFKTTLVKCIPETSIEFWNTAEGYFCWPSDHKKRTRIQSILKAAKDHGIKIT